MYAHSLYVAQAFLQARVVAPTGGGEVGEVVHFTEDAGKPMRFYLGDGYFDRVK